MRHRFRKFIHKTGREPLPVFLLAFSILSQTGCGTSPSTSQQIIESSPTEATTHNDDQQMSPKVFATLPSSFDGSIKIENKDVISLEPEDKPDGAVPRHVQLTIDGEYANQVRDSESIPSLGVYEIERFREILATQPETLNGFNERLEVLRSLLAEKRDVRSQGEIEIVRYIEEMQVLNAHPKYISFKDGHALVYLTQFQPDAGYVTNRGLTYIVQGLTNDGKYYLFGTFPVSVRFLPEDSDISDFEGYKIPMYSPTAAEAEKHSQYLRRIEQRLQNTAPEKFQPDLREIEEFISSIEIREH